MAKFNRTHKDLLVRFTRPIVHIRTQMNLRRFGLVFGAGLSKSLGLPSWSDLVKKIAKDRTVRGEKIFKKFQNRTSLPYKTELLFQHFREQQAKRSPEPYTLKFENDTFAKWLKLCAEYLYKRAPNDFKSALKSHPYLLKYLPIVQNTQLTVNYNFDDFIERALAIKRKSDDKTKGYETVTNPWAQFRRETGVIYHPNGIVPQGLMELPVDRFVFTESSFAKQFLGTLSGELSGLLNHLSKNTCIIIGSSLEDEMLRNLLVRSAETNPGNFHYYFYYLKKNKALSKGEAQAISRAHFCVYNLITLFLREDELAAFGDLINPDVFDNDEISDEAEILGIPIKYCFYLTGPLGVGKSTTISQLHNLTVLDEWLERRPEILSEPWDTLTSVEKTKADNWIAKQFKLKNDKLRHGKLGIFIIDRPPMDPLAFEKPDRRPAKAKSFLNKICPKHRWGVVKGTVILLTGHNEDLAARVIGTGRGGYTSVKLQKMEDDLKDIYKCPNLRIIDTKGMSIRDVTKRVAEIIHFEEYKPCNLDEMLAAIRDSGKNNHA
jgi:hypothetical protein